MFHTGIGVYLPLYVYIAVIGAGLLSIFKNPRLGFYVIIMLVPLQRLRARVRDFPGGEHVLPLLAICVVIGLFIRNWWPAASRLNKFLILFAVFLYFSLWQGSFFLNGPLPLALGDARFSDYRDYVLMLALCPMAAACCRSRRDIKIVLGVMVFTMLMTGRSYLMEATQHSSAQYRESAREAGPMGIVGENGLAAFEVQLTMVIAGLAAFEKKRLRRWGWYAIMAFNVLCIQYTYTRAGYLGLALGLLLLAFTKKRMLLVPLFIFALAWQTVVPTAVRQRIMMTENQDTGQLDNSSATRLTLWTDALQLFAQDPVFGTGWDTYKYMGRHAYLRDTHNLFLKVMVEGGMIGLGFTLALLAIMFRQAWRLFRRSRDVLYKSLGYGMVLMMPVLFTQNMFGDRWGYIEINGFVWILFGLSLRALALEAEELAPAVSEGEQVDIAELEPVPA